MDEELKKLLREWTLQTRRMQWCHFASENRLRSLHFRIGVPSIILSVIAGSSVIVGGAHQSADKGLAPGVSILIALTSLGAAILTSLQTFLKLEERANQHNQAARLYGAIRLRLRKLLAGAGGDARAEVESIEAQMKETESRVPAIPAKIWSKRNAITKDDEFEGQLRDE